MSAWFNKKVGDKGRGVAFTSYMIIRGQGGVLFALIALDSGSIPTHGHNVG